MNDDLRELLCKQSSITGRKERRKVIRIHATLILGALAALLVALTGAWPGLETGAAANPKRTIYMSAVEYKGSTSSEPFPVATPPAGGGYILKSPDADGKWETSTYRWDPGTIMVNQDDEVELWIWGVNGAQHPSYIEGYVPQFNVTRGNLTVLNFKADKVGTFRIHCNVHQPSMESQFIVLPASAAAAANPTPAPTSPVPAQLPSTGSGPGETVSWWLLGVLALAGLATASGLSLLVLRHLRK